MTDTNTEMKTELSVLKSNLRDLIKTRYHTEKEIKSHIEYINYLESDIQTFNESPVVKLKGFEYPALFQSRGI